MTLILLSHVILPHDLIWTCSSVPAKGAVQTARVSGRGSQPPLSHCLLFLHEKEKKHWQG